MFHCACFVRHDIPRPISLAVPFGAMESRERLAPEEHAALIERNRSRALLALGLVWRVHRAP